VLQRGQQQPPSHSRTHAHTLLRFCERLKLGSSNNCKQFCDKTRSVSTLRKTLRIPATVRFPPPVDTFLLMRVGDASGKKRGSAMPMPTSAHGGPSGPGGTRVRVELWNHLVSSLLALAFEDVVLRSFILFIGLPKQGTISTKGHVVKLRLEAILRAIVGARCAADELSASARRLPVRQQGQNFQVALAWRRQLTRDWQAYPTMGVKAKSTKLFESIPDPRSR
jgi:hypothetical protein